MGAEEEWLHLPAGNHSYQFCATSKDRPGTYTWHVAYRLNKSSQLLIKAGQVFAVTA